MNTSDARFQELLALAIESELAADDAAELNAALFDQPARQAEYLRQLRMHALLTWRSGRGGKGSLSLASAAARPVADTAPAAAAKPSAEAAPAANVALPAPAVVPSPTGARSRGRLLWLALAAAVVLMFGLTVGRRLVQPGPAAGPPPLAQLIEVKNCLWPAGSAPRAAGSILETGPLAFDGGTLRWEYASGVEVTLEGPAAIELVDPQLVVVHRGKATAHVPEAGVGFTIRTPAADVVDQGTEFGVAVDERGTTDVVVFRGMVDVARHIAPTPSPQRLTQGQGVRIAEGTTTRLQAIERERALSTWRVTGKSQARGVITGVWDNLLSVESLKCYCIVRAGLREDALAYVDREYQWNGIDKKGLPDFLRQADYVMTFNDDKQQADLVISIDLAGPARLFVLLDDRAPPPDWLQESFHDTGFDIGMDEKGGPAPGVKLAKGAGQSIDRHFSIWERKIHAAGIVVLGPNQARSMYGVAATPE